MSLSKNERLTQNAQYSTISVLFMFIIYVDGKSVCLIYTHQISVVKECSIRRQLVSLHSDKFRHFQGKGRWDKLKELLCGLNKQRSIFSRSMEVSDVAVLASYLIAKDIVVASKPFSDGESAKNVC